MTKKQILCGVALAVSLGALVVNQASANPLPQLKVSENQRYLVTADGKPFFYLADTAWELFHRLNRAEADLYLRNRAAKGFTVIQAVVLGEIDGLKVPNAYGETPFVNFDASQPNEHYFAHVDWVVNRAAELGLYVGLLPTWGRWAGGNDEGRTNNNFINVENAEAYGSFLAKRYADKPVIWILGGDRSATKSLDLWPKMAAGIRTHVGKKQLISYHPRDASSEFYHNADWLYFNMIQSGHSPESLNFAPIERDYALQPTKPCLDAEPAYEYPPDAIPEKRPVGARQIRRNAYWAVFAGALGHAYGTHPIWQMYDDGWPKRSNAKNRLPRWDIVTPWYAAMDLPGAEQLKHLKDLMLSRPVLKRIPDQSALVTPRANDLNRVQITRDGTVGQNDATYLMAYFPAHTEATIDTTKINARSLRGWWFNPRDGSVKPLNKFSNKKQMKFAPPTNVAGEDWVLVLDDASQKYPTPGK
ncbi:MAG: glycoside hydrolase family 140 protein [Verrucomicrobiota bacterium]